MPKKLSSNRTFSASERKVFFRKARLIHRQNELDIRLMKRESEESALPGRILIITPRKIGTAPKRNLIRRRLKAIFYEENLPSYSYDLLIYCQKGSTDLPFGYLKSLIVAIFSTLSTGTLQK